MRDHSKRFDGYERGEGNHCSIGLGSLIAPIAGGLINTLFADTQPLLTQTSNPWAPAAAESTLSEAQRLYGASGFAPQANPLELLGRENLLGYAEGALPGLIDTVQGSWMRGLDPGLNPYVAPMIQAAQNDLGNPWLQRQMFGGLRKRTCWTP